MTKFSAIAAALALTFAANASATVLNTSLAVDNGYIAYISTSNNTQGTAFASGNDWTTTYFGSTNLNAGTDYFLHIYAYDQGGIAGMLGEFGLVGDKHKFANGLSTMLTNTANFKGNNTGFGSAYGATIDLGIDGVGPWGFRPSINDNARWIWAGNAELNNAAYFTAKISAVPEPGSIALLGMGILGLALSRRKSKQ